MSETLLVALITAVFSPLLLKVFERLWELFQARRGKADATAAAAAIAHEESEAKQLQINFDALREVAKEQQAQLVAVTANYNTEIELRRAVEKDARERLDKLESECRERTNALQDKLEKSREDYIALRLEGQEKRHELRNEIQKAWGEAARLKIEMLEKEKQMQSYLQEEQDRLSDRRRTQKEATRLEDKRSDEIRAEQGT